MPGYPPIADLLPHAPPMVLLGEALSITDDAIVARATIADGMPFLRDGAIPSYIGLEFMAQAIAAYAGFHGRSSGHPPKIGFLLATRRYSVTVPTFALDLDLTVAAQRTFDDGEMAAFDCRILAGDHLLAEATLTVYQPSHIESFYANHGQQ